MAHPVWAITWAKSDTATLTPQLPTLTISTKVPTWTPGQKLSTYDPYHPNFRQFVGDVAYFLLVVGVPITVALISGCCVWCCWGKRKKDRRPNVVYVNT